MTGKISTVLLCSRPFGLRGVTDAAINFSPYNAAKVHL